MIYIVTIILPLTSADSINKNLGNESSGYKLRLDICYNQVPMSPNRNRSTINKVVID